MASGKPIISTVKMGYSIIKKYECGIELNSDTPVDLASAVIKMHNMNEEKLEKIGINARIASEDFDFDILTGKLLKVIENL